MQFVQRILLHQTFTQKLIQVDATIYMSMHEQQQQKLAQKL